MLVGLAVLASPVMGRGRRPRPIPRRLSLSGKPLAPPRGWISCARSWARTARRPFAEGAGGRRRRPRSVPSVRWMSPTQPIRASHRAWCSAPASCLRCRTVPHSALERRSVGLAGFPGMRDPSPSPSNAHRLNHARLTKLRSRAAAVRRCTDRKARRRGTNGMVCDEPGSSMGRNQRPVVHLHRARRLY